MEKSNNLISLLIAIAIILDSCANNRIYKSIESVVQSGDSIVKIDIPSTIHHPVDSFFLVSEYGLLHKKYDIKHSGRGPWDSEYMFVMCDKGKEVYSEILNTQRNIDVFQIDFKDWQWGSPTYYKVPQLTISVDRDIMVITISPSEDEKQDFTDSNIINSFTTDK